LISAFPSNSGDDPDDVEDDGAEFSADFVVVDEDEDEKAQVKDVNFPRFDLDAVAVDNSVNLDGRESLRRLR